MARSPAAAEAVSEAPEARQVAISDLDFDAENPRLRDRVEQDEQDEILRILWREFAVDEVALSIAANGYFQYEPLFAARENGRLVVVEGNRRLAAVKLLLDADARQAVGATDLPRITVARRRGLQTLPVIERSRDETWQYLGFKHVNGPQPWQSHSKAQYIAWVHNELGVSLDEIASHIGDQHLTVKRLYRGLMVLEQAEKAGVFSLEDRWSKRFAFSHLYTGLNYDGIQKFIGLAPQRFTAKPVRANKMPELGELLLWLYGSKSREQPPVIQSQNPDLRRLDDVLQSADGVAALRRRMPLSVSLDISKGDTQLFRELLVEAKRTLQEARGRLLTGYQGETDLLDTAEDVSSLASSIHQEMLDVHAESRTGTTRRAGTRRSTSRAR